MEWPRARARRRGVLSLRASMLAGVIVVGVCSPEPGTSDIFEPRPSSVGNTRADQEPTSELSRELAPNEDPSPGPAVFIEAEPAPPAAASAPVISCPHRTLRSACNEFESLVSDDDDPQECRHDDVGMMPDGVTRYHVVRRMSTGSSQAQLLIFESEGCFTNMDTLSWNTPLADVATLTGATWSETLDLDGDGHNEIAFRVAQTSEDVTVTPERISKARVSRYCRLRAGAWECTGTMQGRPQADAWPTN